MLEIKKYLLATATLTMSLHAYANHDLARKAKPLYTLLPSHAATKVAVPGLSPAQVQRAYGFSYLPFKGEGQIVGVIVAFDNPNIEADLGVFSSNFGLPACTTANGCFRKMSPSGTLPPTDVNWGVEATIEVQWVHAMAPNAKIYLIEAADDSLGSLMTAVNFAVQKGVNTVSIGWGTPEFAGELALDSNFNVDSVTFFAASGSTGNGTLYPSVSPYITAVGGTTLSVDTNGNYLSETAWAGSGGGLSAFEPQPAYQTNFPIPNNPNNMRGVPDVAYNADKNSGYAIYDTFGKTGWLVAGGAGAGAAQWAAFAAVAKSGTHLQIKNFNSELYAAATKNYLVAFNPITSGSNGACGYYCTAIFGYNYVTGLGTPQAQFLAYSVIVPGLKK